MSPLFDGMPISADNAIRLQVLGGPSDGDYRHVPREICTEGKVVRLYDHTYIITPLRNNFVLQYVNPERVDGS